jgi:sulfur carrier protein
MENTVNGEMKDVGEVRTVENLMTLLGFPPRPGGVAVAVNGAVVPRSEWPTAPLAPGDAVELIHAVQGG